MESRDPMTHVFNPNTNPYAYDLLRLRAAPPGRYSHEERQSLARIIASKLYELNLNAPFHIDRFYSSWTTGNQYGAGVQIEAIFDNDMAPNPALAAEISHLEEGPCVILGVRTHGVVELFNGVVDGRNRQPLIDSIKRGLARKDADSSADERGVIPRRRDADCAAIYQGEGSGGSDSGSDGGGNGRSGPNGGFDGDPPDGPDGPDGPGDGSGGVGEVINHPVLFSVERDVFDAILGEI